MTAKQQKQQLFSVGARSQVNEKESELRRKGCELVAARTDLHEAKTDALKARAAIVQKDLELAALRQATADPDVQALIAAKRPYLKLGLSYASRSELAPLLSVVTIPEVSSALLETGLTVADVVNVITSALEDNVAIIQGCMSMPVFAMQGSAGLYTGKAWNNTAEGKARSLALALAVARDNNLRNSLKQELIPAYTESDRGSDWSTLNPKLFSSKDWQQEDHNRGDNIVDVLLAVAGKEVAGYFKYERVAAALMLGLLMKEGLME